MKLLNDLEKAMKEGWEIRYNPEKKQFYSYYPNIIEMIVVNTLDELLDKINATPTK